MSFASIGFFVFFAVVLVTTWLLEKLGKIRAKEVFLLLVSYFFYGYWDWRFCFLLLFVTITAFFTAKATGNRLILSIGIIVPLLVLGFFKYFNFFLSSFSAMIGEELGTLAIILPVGISFYTFQALSYVIDVKRNQIEAESDFVKMALYIGFFPQLVAGPIVKAKDFLPQLHEDGRVTAAGIKTGIQLMAFGFVKKIVLADHLSVFVDDVFSAPGAYHGVTIVWAVISYALQIYFDFSGYSDIAIGCARCMGYDFLPNFDLPYTSPNVTIFWRRWHISLSTWLKEYLYIPLGGNRKGKARQFLNLFLTMLLGGLWHGANWTFVFWGALHGGALCIDKILPRKKEQGVISKSIGVFVTFSFVCFAWIFFRAETFDVAWQVVKGIFTMQDGVMQMFSWTFVSVVVLLVATLCAAVRSKKRAEKAITGYYPTVNLDTVFGLTVFFVVWGLILGLAFIGEAPFVYFQF